MQTFEFQIPKGMKATIANGAIEIKSIKKKKKGFYQIKRIKAKIGVLPMETDLVLANTKALTKQEN